MPLYLPFLSVNVNPQKSQRALRHGRIGMKHTGKVHLT